VSVWLLCPPAARERGGRQGDLPDECKLFVGNLPQAYDSNMLRQLFSQHAEVVHSAVITEPGSNLSKGFGFIHIPDPAKVRIGEAAGQAHKRGGAGRHGAQIVRTCARQHA
jgi:hypothetical protein